MRRRKVVGLLLFLLMIGLVGIPVWLTYRQMRQEKLDRDLIAAIKHKDTPAALSLLAQGADPNARDDHNVQPPSVWRLLWDSLRSRHSQPSTAPTALQLTIEPITGSRYNYLPGFTPEKLMLVKAVLEYGARVNTQDSDGSTPLIMATELDHIATIKLLLAHGADVNRADSSGNTPSMCVLGDPDLLSYLLANRANVNARDDRGWTLLMNAAFLGSTEAVRVLLDHHADVNIKTKNGDTALALAKKQGWTDTVRLLKQAGAKE